MDIVAVPTETKLGSTTFRFGSEHERKMSSIDPATEQCLSCVSRRSVILLMEDRGVYASYGVGSMHHMQEGSMQHMQGGSMHHMPGGSMHHMRLRVECGKD